MTQNPWQHAFIVVALFGSLASVVRAEDAPEAASIPAASSVAPAATTSRGHIGRNSSKGGSYGFLGSLEKTVGLTPEQVDAVRGLLADQRQKSKALREETDGKIRALLNPEQVKKFDAMLAEQKANNARRFARS